VDTTLRGNLACAGNALTVAGTGVTLDLGGFRVAGNGSGVGITVAADNVTIRNGTVTGFASGIGFGDRTDTNTTFADAAITGNNIGIDVTQVPRRLAFTVQGGILNGTTSAVMGRRGGPFTFTGVNLAGRLSFVDVVGVTLTGSTMHNASLNFSETNQVQISGNATMVNTSVSFFAGTGLVVRNNTFSGADVAVELERGGSRGVQITGNTFSGNTFGVRADLTQLAEMPGADISRNTFTNNRAAGIFIQAIDPGPTTTVTVSGNTFTGNGSAPGGRTDRGGRPIDDGLHLTVPPNPSVVVGGNTARTNAGYGIEATTPVSDGGGVNHASGNGNAAQCLGVTCAP
jgi:hypothetical protein